jgi:hypothetical protein
MHLLLNLSSNVVVNSSTNTMEIIINESTIAKILIDKCPEDKVVS